jgi:anti-sigma factor RsiW
MTDNCAAFTALLVRVADDLASAQERAQLDAHLATCPSCAAALADQRDAHAWLSAQPVAGASLGFDARVMAAIRADADGRVRGWLDSLDFRRWTWRLVPVAAALALVAVTVTRTDAPQTGTAETVTVSDTDSLPVSSALWSDSVSGSSLLSLMLTASADDSLATHRKDQ